MWLTGFDVPSLSTLYLDKPLKAHTLMQAIAKLSLMPALRLEAFVPEMKAKGRIRVGADADVVVFDPATVVDRATFEQSLQYSEGFAHVLVGGDFVVRDGALVEAAYPGRALRLRAPGEFAH